MTQPVTQRAPLRLPRAAVWLLLLALLHAQWLGQWHRVAHAPSVAVSGLVAAAAQAEERTLFGHVTDDAAQCRLYDQLGSADALGSAPCVASPPPAPPAPVVTPLAGSPGRALRPYQARGPPLA